MDKLVATDLDGTLFNNQQEVSELDYYTLMSLPRKNICRVIATGRNLHSFRQSIPHGFPIDYLVFSSGAGIANWKTGEIVYSVSLNSEAVSSVAKKLIELKIDFFIQQPIPENHKLYFYRANKHNPDFKRRLNRYWKYSYQLDPEAHKYGKACQLLAVIPNDEKLLNTISSNISGVKIIRSTSPLDGKSMWIEFFPENVSKGNGVHWVCQHLDIAQEKTLSIGNDYNDIDLLNFTARSFVVANAPEVLKKQYEISKSNQNSGFTYAVDRFLN